jgi:hypothetical protein
MEKHAYQLGQQQLLPQEEIWTQLKQEGEDHCLRLSEIIELNKESIQLKERGISKSKVYVVFTNSCAKPQATKD